MIPLDVTILWHPKDAEHPREYEDAFAIGDCGIAAIADGVSEAIFSRQWAKILTSTTVEFPVNPDDSEAFASWLLRARDQWQGQITNLQLSWMQRQKLQAVRGAYSTLLWVEFLSDDSCIRPAASQLPFVCRAIGDCCLFQIRDGALLRSFPLTEPEEFERDPVTVCSTQWRPDSELTFSSMNGCLRTGDTIVLSSDAFAKWALQAIARKEEINWAWFEGLDSQEWSEWVASVRDRSPDQRMRVDDTTLIFIRPQLELDRDLSCDETPSAKAPLPTITVRKRIVAPLSSQSESDETGKDDNASPSKEVVGADYEMTEAESSDAHGLPTVADQSQHDPSESDTPVRDEPQSASPSDLHAINDTTMKPASPDSDSEPSRENQDESVVTRIWRSLRPRN